MNDKDFYYAFEARFRGSRELIKSRQMVYVPFLEKCKSVFGADCRALDLGCGRGEWLEILEEQKIPAVGIDLDDDMIAYCQGRGFSAAKDDALLALKDMADESSTIISGFHIAEHLPFNGLLELVNEAKRVLMPGGILILETPNAENIMVGSQNFYIDPTHKRPIPMETLAFIAEYYGFARVKRLRLQEDKGLLAREEVGIYEVLTGVSPDYSIVAQKNYADESQKLAFDGVFSGEQGLPLPLLCDKYDEYHIKERMKSNERINAIEENNISIKAMGENNAARIETIEGNIVSIKAMEENSVRRIEAIEKLQQQREKEISEILTSNSAYQEKLDGLLNSRSWKATRPLRFLGRLARKVRNCFR